MKNTFEDFERKVKSLNEDEIEFPIDLGTMQVVETPAEGEDKPKVEVTEIKTEKCSEHEKKEEKEECDCPFKKAMDMLILPRQVFLSLKMLLNQHQLFRVAQCQQEKMSMEE